MVSPQSRCRISHDYGKEIVSTGNPVRRIRPAAEQGPQTKGRRPRPAEHRVEYYGNRMYFGVTATGEQSIAIGG
jgi:hypothetical protein